MIATRFVIAVGVLLAVALIPTVMHSYLGLRRDDGLRVRSIDTVLAGFTATPTSRLAAWVQETFDSYDWMERRYRAPHGEEVLLFAARSYDWKRLYHHPEIGILRGVDLAPGGVHALPGVPGMQAHLLRSRAERGLAAYVLLYDGRTVQHPIAEQMLHALWLVLGPRKPMTLILAYDGQRRSEASFGESSAATVLAAAVKHFVSQNGPPVR